MSIVRLVMAFAGGMILLSKLISRMHRSYWLLFTAFVGFHLLHAGFTVFARRQPSYKNRFPIGHSLQVMHALNRCHYPL